MRLTGRATVNQVTTNEDDRRLAPPAYSAQVRLRAEINAARRELQGLRDLIQQAYGSFVLEVDDFEYEIHGFVGRWPLNALRSDLDWQRFLEQASLRDLRVAIGSVRNQYGPILEHYGIRFTDLPDPAPATSAKAGDGSRHPPARRLVGDELKAERAQVQKAIDELKRDGVDQPSVRELADILVRLAGGGTVEAKRRWLDDHLEVLEGFPIRRNRQRARPTRKSESLKVVSESPKITPGSVPDLR
jgi:hypothetical protein